MLSVKRRVATVATIVGVFALALGAAPAQSVGVTAALAESELVAAGTARVQAADGPRAAASVLAYRTEGGVAIRVGVCRPQAPSCEVFEGIDGDATLSADFSGHVDLVGELPGLGAIDVDLDRVYVAEAQTCTDHEAQTAYLVMGPAPVDADVWGEIGLWKVTNSVCGSFVEDGAIKWVGP